MFVDAALAARIDRVEARLSVAIATPIADASITPLDGAAAILARPGSPINKIIGIGFDTTLDPAVLTALESHWRARGEPVRVELSTLASPQVAEQLATRGYRLLGFEHVLIRPLTADDATRDPAHPVTETRIDWQDILVEGFSTPDGTGTAVDNPDREAIAAVMADFTAAPGFQPFVATLDAAPAGAATLRIDDGIALLCGATTLPTARRRGIQAALLTARLRTASQSGCTLAVVTTAPGSQSQHNALRQGFTLAYARAILVLP